MITSQAQGAGGGERINRGWGTVPHLVQKCDLGFMSHGTIKRPRTQIHKKVGNAKPWSNPKF